MKKSLLWCAVALITVSAAANAVTLQPFLQTQLEFSQSQQPADTLVLLVPANSSELALAHWSNASRSQINRAMQVAEFNGKSGSKLEIIAPVGMDYGRVVLLVAQATRQPLSLMLARCWSLLG